MLLTQTAWRVDQMVADVQASGRAPSVAAAVIRNGAVVHFAGAGESPRPDRNTQFRIGSITKTMTAAVVLSLCDQGLLGLDDPLERHLPDTGVGRATLRQLLGHVGGLKAEPEGDWWERSVGMDVVGLLSDVTPAKVAHLPLRTYHYSNLAYGLLGALVERVTGESWWTEVSKRVLVPLSMNRTTYHPTEPFARGYVVHPWHGTLREEPRHDAGAMAPAGQLWSSADDLGKWAAFLADPVSSVLGRDTVGRMCAPVVIVDSETWSSGHGLGVELWRRGERVFVGHTGSMPGYLAVLAVHRQSRTAVVGFANAYTLRGASILGLGLGILDAVLDGEPSPPRAPWRPGAAPPPEMEPLTGRWWWMGREYEAAWDAAAGDLVISRTGSSVVPWRLRLDGPDRWRCHSGGNDGEIMTVRRTPAGAVAALDIATCVFTRDPWPAL